MDWKPEEVLGEGMGVLSHEGRRVISFLPTMAVRGRRESASVGVRGESRPMNSSREGTEPSLK